MRPLGTFTTQELVSTLDYLDQQKIPHQVDGKSVLVSAENYADIRLRLTRAGLANNSDASNDGEAILLKDSSFGVSQRMESERLKLSRRASWRAPSSSSRTSPRPRCCWPSRKTTCLPATNANPAPPWS